MNSQNENQLEGFESSNLAEKELSGAGVLPKRQASPRVKTASKKLTDQNYVYYPPGDSQNDFLDEDQPSMTRKPKRERRKGAHQVSTSPSSNSSNPPIHQSSMPGAPSTLKPERSSSPPFNNGRWLGEEHFRFLEALKIYGKEWQKV